MTPDPSLKVWAMDQEHLPFGSLLEKPVLCLLPQTLKVNLHFNSILASFTPL